MLRNFLLIGRAAERPRSKPAEPVSERPDQRNDDGDERSEPIGDPEFFLMPLLASDPIPYLFDSEGTPIDAEGRPIANGKDAKNGSEVSAAILKLQKETRPRGLPPD
jgi:hypothetical protein